MIGLLYKDFISVERIHKIRLTWVIGFLTIVYCVLRVVFSGRNEIKELIVENDSGEMINLMDTFFVLGLAIFLIAIVSVINSWVAKIIESDEKNKINDYLYAMPITKKSYILSKYIFIAVAALFFLGIVYVWGILCREFCQEGYMMEMTKIVIKFIPAFIGLAILSAAIELPLFILLGKSKAMLIKIAIIMGIAFVLIGYVMFGNLSWISEHLDVVKMLIWLQEHKKEVELFCTCMPMISLVLLYLSYRVTILLTSARIVISRE